MRHVYIMMLVAASIAAAAEDPKGWTKTRWGMTDAEILAAVPDAVRAEKVDPDQRARVVIESLDVAGVVCKVYFAPGEDGRLAHVLITPHGRSTDHTFQVLEAALVDVYGRPWKSEEHGDTDLQWTFASTRITLTKSILPTLPGMDRVIIVSLVYARRTPSPL